MDVFQIEPELVCTLEELDKEGLLEFAALYEDTKSDADKETAIVIQFLLFTKSSSPDFLDAALHQARTWLEETATDHPDRSRRIQIIDMMLAVQLTHSEPREREPSTTSPARPFMLEIPIEFIQQWLQIEELWSRFQQSNDAEELTVTITALKRLIPTIPRGFGHIGSWLCNNGIELLERYVEHERIEDLHGAVEIAGLAVDAASQSNVKQAICLGNLGNCLGRRSEVLGTEADRDNAINSFERAISMTPADDPNRAIWQGLLGSRLIRKFEQTNSDADLDRAVDVAEMAVAAMPKDSPHRATMLENLGLCLGNKYKRSGHRQSLTRAIAVIEEGLSLVDVGSGEWVEMEANLSLWLSERSTSTGSPEDLDRAIKAAEAAVSHGVQGSEGRIQGLRSLGFCLSQRFERTLSARDLDRAIEVADSAIDLTPESHPNHAAWSLNLGKYLFLRFEHIGSIEDIDRAIELTKLSVNAVVRNKSESSVGYNNLAIFLCTKFERMGNLEDITRAVDWARMAVEATPMGSPDRPSWSSNLGTCLGRRFERTGSMEDLDGAIRASKAAIDLVAPEHPDRARWLNNYALWLHSRFKRLRSLSDINEGIEAVKTAIQITPADSPRQPVWLANLAIWLSDRARETNSTQDVDEAVRSAEKAVNSPAVVEADRAARFNNLGVAFWVRYTLGDSAEDLDNAIAAATKAIEASPPEYPERARHFENLGTWLFERYQNSTMKDHEDQALSCYEQGWACNTASPSDRISLARRVARIYASRNDWNAASGILTAAIELLPLVSTRMLEQNEKQHMISRFSGLASLAAVAALNAKEGAFQALELLEQGRCVISGLLLDMRTDLSRLADLHPDVAATFGSLIDELDSPTRDVALVEQSTPSLRSRTDRRFEADQQFAEVVAKIRTLAGFERFLLPSTADELMAAARQGPIVIFNIHSYRCDAFIVQQNQVTALPLPYLTEKDLDDKLRQASLSSTVTLEWLWTAALCPVLEALQYRGKPEDKTWPRVWWIPTGALSHFPLHAAGFHMQRTQETVIDRVMSSYSSSIKALVYGRRAQSRQSTAFSSEEALLISMESTTSQQRLPFAAKEVEMLISLCDSLRLKPVLPKPCRKEVLQSLATCKVFHFAGHGLSDPSDPSKSCILLDDWVSRPLTVGDLQENHLKGNFPFLGFLSACSTSTNRAKRLVDEGIHLVSAFQLAGFRHVIGTLWEVSDSHCVHVAKILYETLRDEGLTDDAVCLGLHLAIRALRDSDIEMGPTARNGEIIWEDEATTATDMGLYWVPYIHFGP